MPPALTKDDVLDFWVVCSLVLNLVNANFRYLYIPFAKMYDDTYDSENDEDWDLLALYHAAISENIVPSQTPASMIETLNTTLTPEDRGFIEEVLNMPVNQEVLNNPAFRVVFPEH